MDPGVSSGESMSLPPRDENGGKRLQPEGSSSYTTSRHSGMFEHPVPTACIRVSRQPESEKNCWGP